MLELVEDEAQAVRVVRLALEVDLRLGASLAGAVKPEWQKQTVDLVTKLKFPQLIKIELMKLTKSEKAIPELVKALNNLVKAFNDKEDDYVRRIAAKAVGKIGQHPPHRRGSALDQISLNQKTY